MKKEKRLNHAKHNEEVCRLIHQNSKYPDWVITTAFYTAVHYVSYKIFPLKEKDDQGNDLEFINLEYFYSYHKLATKRISKHAALADLVYDYFPSISPDYDWLCDLCHKARYQNYQQRDADADMAIKLLDRIKTALSV